MKKSLLVLSALAMLSVAFVGCKGNGDTTADDASDPAITDPTGGEEQDVCTIDFDSQYGAVKIVIENDWKSLDVDFTATPSEVQFVYRDSMVNPNDQWGNPYVAYSGAANVKTTNKIVIADALNQLQTQTSGRADATAVADISIQNTKAGANKVTIKKLTATKSDGSTVELAKDKVVVLNNATVK